MEQYTALEVVTGLTTVQGQLVMVKVVDWRMSVMILSVRWLDIKAATRSLTLSQLQLLGIQTHVSDGVGDAVEAQGGGSWAVGGVGSEHLGDIVDGGGAVLGPGGNGGCESGNGDGGGELHFDGCLILFTLKVKGESFEVMRLQD